MLKCPHCGSTAQVELIGMYDTINPNEQEIYMQCGCGCHFTAYAVIDPDKTYIENEAEDE